MHCGNLPFMPFGIDQPAPSPPSLHSAPSLSRGFPKIASTVCNETAPTPVVQIPLEIWASIVAQIHHIPTLLSLQCTSKSLAMIYQQIYTEYARKEHKKPYKQATLAFVSTLHRRDKVSVPLPGTPPHHALKDRWTDVKLTQDYAYQTLIPQDYIHIWASLLQPEIRENRAYTAHLMEVLLILSDHVENTSSYTTTLFQHGLSWPLFNELADIHFDRCALLMIKYFFPSFIYMYHRCLSFPTLPFFAHLNMGNIPPYYSDLLNFYSFSIHTPIHDFFSARLPTWSLLDINELIKYVDQTHPSSIFSLLEDESMVDTRVFDLLQAMLTLTQKQTYATAILSAAQNNSNDQKRLAKPPTFSYKNVVSKSKLLSKFFK